MADEGGAAARQLEVVGVRVGGVSKSPILVLKEMAGDRYLPIPIGPNEATAIAYAQQGFVPPRPLTHDLMRDILDAVHVSLIAVYITVLRDDIFYAELLFSSGAEVTARPSDAAALALRTGAPIYATEEILAEAGVALPDELEPPEPGAS